MPVKLIMTACDSSSDIISLHGIDRRSFVDYSSYELAGCNLDDFRTRKDAALVGSKIADRYSWKPGQQIVLDQLNGISFHISGIFTSSNSAQENLILVDRKFLQEATDKQGISNHVVVRLKPGADPNEACRAIDALPLTVETTTQPEQAFLTQKLSQLMDLVEISKFVIGIVVMVVLVTMGNAISMTTQERFHEFGIMRTLGYRKGLILSLVLAEGLMLTLSGGLVGSAFVWGIIHSGQLKSVSACGVSISMEASMLSMIMGILVVAAAGLIGSFLPAWKVSRLPVTDAIRKRN